MVKRLKRVRRNKTNSKRRVKGATLTPEIIERLKSMPILPDGKPNPFYISLPHQNSQNLDVAGNMKLQDANHRLQETRSDNVMLKSSIESLKKDIETKRKENEQLEKEKMRAEKEKELLDKQAKANRTKDQLIHDLGLVELAKEVDEVESSKREYQQKIDRVKKDLDKNKRFQELKNLKDGVEVLKIEYEKLNKDLTEADMIDAYQLQVLQNERDELENKVKLKKEARKAQIDIAVKKQLISQLEADPALKLQKLEEFTAERDKLKKSIEERKEFYGAYKKYLKQNMYNAARSSFKDWFSNKRFKDKTVLPETISWFDSITIDGRLKKLKDPNEYITEDEKLRLKRLDTDIAALEKINENVNDTVELEKSIFALNEELDSHRGKLDKLKQGKTRARKLAEDYLEKTAEIDALLASSKDENLNEELYALRREILKKQQELKAKSLEHDYIVSKFEKVDAAKKKSKELSDEIELQNNMLQEARKDGLETKLNNQISNLESENLKLGLKLNEQKGEVKYLQDLNNKQIALKNQNRDLSREIDMKLDHLEDEIKAGRRKLIEYEGEVLAKKNLNENLDKVIREHATLKEVAAENEKLMENIEKIRELPDLKGNVNESVKAYINISSANELQRDLKDAAKHFYHNQFDKYMEKRTKLIDNVNYINNFKKGFYDAQTENGKRELKREMRNAGYGYVLDKPEFDAAELSEDRINELFTFISKNIVEEAT